jgi:hypothetical protein
MTQNVPSEIFLFSPFINQRALLARKYMLKMLFNIPLFS